MTVGAEVFQRCGVELPEGKPPVLHTSAALFRFKLAQTISSDSTMADQIGDFIDQLLEPHNHISLYLDPVSVASTDDTLSHPGLSLAQPESLVRLILGIDTLQPRLIRTLLEKLPEFIGDEEEAKEHLGETKTWVKVLRQLRWLDYIVDSSELTEKLLEALGFVPPDMQSEIIAALPDIVSDADGGQVSRVLALMLKEAPELTLPILETLGSLECSPALLLDARNSIVTHLVSAEPLDLPVMIKFLLQSGPADSSPATIQRIRRRLDMDSILLVSRQPSKSSTAHTNNDGQAPDVLIFDVITTSLRTHKHLRDAWLKIISTDEDKIGPQTTLDIVVLLVLHQVSTYTKRVESVLRAKIDTVSSGAVAYTPMVMDSVISRFPAVFAAHFPALLSVGSWLVRTSPLGSQGARVASAMLVAAFSTMGMLQRQEIALELAVHIGSGNANEIDTASRIFLDLAQKHPWQLRPFAVYIKGLLDYVDNLTIEHMRVIFDALGIMSTLSSSNGEAGGSDDSMFNDLYIFVRKQLSSVYPRYNRIGIVGTVSLLRQLGTGSPSALGNQQNTLGSASGASSSTQAPQVNIQALRRAVQLLEMLMDSAKHQSWAFISMTYDELAHIVETKGLHIQLLTWLHENVSSTFASQFLADPEQLLERYQMSQPPFVALSLDKEEPTVLDILNHNNDAIELGLHQAVKRSTASMGSPALARRLRGSLLACLPALLRLIQVCEKALGDGTLGDIDALLVCGIYMIPSITTNTYATDKTQFTIANDAENDCSMIISEDALASTDEDSRRELVAQLSTWSPELRRILCSSLYVAANWIRETINAFADQTSVEIRSKVLVRVNQLAKIENDLAVLATTLNGTVYEFSPIAAGLVPEVSDTPVLRNNTGTVAGASAGSAVRFGGSSMDVDPRQEDATGTLDTEHQQSGFKIDMGGLLLSQDDTRKLVDGGCLSQAASAAGNLVDGTNKKRGVKRKSANASGQTMALDSFAKSPQQYLRELSFSAFGVLNLGISQQSETDDAAADMAPNIGSALDVHGLNLVLRELGSVVGSKLVRHSEKARGFANKASSGAATLRNLATFGSNISGCSANELMASLLPILPALLKYLAGCLAKRAHLSNDIADNELLKHVSVYGYLVTGVDDEQSVSVVGSCIDTLLQIISSVVYWDGLQGKFSQDSDSMLVSVLGILAEHGLHTDHEELAELEAEDLARRAFDYLLGLADLVASTSRVLLLLRMLVAVRNFVPLCEQRIEVQTMPFARREQTMDGVISKLARRILSNEWADSEELKPSDLEYVINSHIMRSPHNRLQLIYKYATMTLFGFVSGTATMDNDQDGGGGGEHARLSRSTFATYYKATIQALGLAIKTINLPLLSGQEVIAFSERVGESWLALTKMTQSIDNTMQRSVLLVALRGSFQLVDLFIKDILPLLDSYFLTYRDNVLTVFSRVQKSTRILQNICNHSKVAKDVRLQAAVPQMKRKLEQLVFQVVALMENNDCSEAINLGNLKHRDIRGQVVGSQIPRSQHYESDEDESDQEEEMNLGIEPQVSEAEEEEEQTHKSKGSTRGAGAWKGRNTTAAAVGAGRMPAGAKKVAYVAERKRQLQSCIRRRLSQTSAKETKQHEESDQEDE
ncbi:Fanconi anemia group D2 protein [Coemansia sp. RSA 1286]|nr:Fanconi anemia group D2 protein [Coemansia sp. RSA 1286]